MVAGASVQDSLAYEANRDTSRVTVRYDISDRAQLLLFRDESAAARVWTEDGEQVYGVRNYSEGLVHMLEDALASSDWQQAATLSFVNTLQAVSHISAIGEIDPAVANGSIDPVPLEERTTPETPKERRHRMILENTYQWAYDLLVRGEPAVDVINRVAQTAEEAGDPSFIETLAAHMPLAQAARVDLSAKMQP